MLFMLHALENRTPNKGDATTAITVGEDILYFDWRIITPLSSTPNTWVTASDGVLFKNAFTKTKQEYEKWF